MIALRARVVSDVVNEVRHATAQHGTFNSAHEGWAVLREEVDELWDEVKKKPANRSIERMRREAVQVAAMAMRFIEDVCERGGDR